MKLYRYMSLGEFDNLLNGLDIYPTSITSDSPDATFITMNQMQYPWKSLNVETPSSLVSFFPDEKKLYCDGNIIRTINSRYIVDTSGAIIKADVYVEFEVDDDTILQDTIIMIDLVNTEEDDYSVEFSVHGYGIDHYNSKLLRPVAYIPITGVGNGLADVTDAAWISLG